MAATQKQNVGLYEGWADGEDDWGANMNGNLRMLDLMAAPRITSILSTPPGSPSDGAAHIVGASPTGVWVGKAGAIARWHAAGAQWEFATPKTGWTVWHIGEATRYRYDTSAWVKELFIPAVTKHAVYIAAGSMRPATTAGCAALAATEISSSQPEILSLNFDSSTQQNALFSMVMPSSWDEGVITFRVHWSHASASVDFGVVFSLQAVAVGDDDPIGVSYGTAQSVTDTGGTTNDLYTTPESSNVTVGGTPQAGDMVFFRLARVVADGGDTLAVAARVLGVTVYINTNEVQDA